MKKENKLFKHFGVNSNEELYNLLMTEPNDPKVKELNELMSKVNKTEKKENSNQE